jgi:hypothetical protein
MSRAVVLWTRWNLSVKFLAIPHNYISLHFNNALKFGNFVYNFVLFTYLMEVIRYVIKNKNVDIKFSAHHEFL